MLDSEKQYSRMQVKRDTAENWENQNPTLLEGEFGYETDTGKFKVGKREDDELLKWNNLDYAPTDTLIDGTVGIKVGNGNEISFSSNSNFISPSLSPIEYFSVNLFLFSSSITNESVFIEQILISFSLQ